MIILLNVSFSVKLKDIEKFINDHGGQLELDFATDDLESKVEAIIRELRNVLKETIPEGGKYSTIVGFV